jgi:hypothetical protein
MEWPMGKHGHFQYYEILLPNKISIKELGECRVMQTYFKFCLIVKWKGLDVTLNTSHIIDQVKLCYEYYLIPVHRTSIQPPTCRSSPQDCGGSQFTVTALFRMNFALVIVRFIKKRHVANPLPLFKITLEYL